VALIALAMGRFVPSQPALVLLVGVAVLALGVTAVEPAAIPLMAMPVLLVAYRVGGGTVDLSASDAALGVATLAALVFAPRPFSRELRTVLWLDAAYQFATLFTVLANPYAANVVEWFHAWMLVSGAVLVGWTIASRGYARLGVSLLLGSTLLLALIALAQAVVQYLGGDLSPVFVSWPYGMHKNFVGTLLAFGAIIAYARPEWLGWRKGRAMMLFWTLSAGLMVTQSRQAILGLGVALVVVAFRRDPIRRRSRLIVLAVVPALVLVATLVKDQLENQNQFNSVFTRINWFAETTAFWLQAPWLGHGLRFWYQPGSQIGYQPPNVFLEVGASSGIVGVVAFAVLLVGTLVVCWRLDPRHGTVAVAVLVSRIVQAQLDLFWVAVQASVPFVIVGICLGVSARAAAASEEARLLRIAAGTGSR
ncbi:MAG: O-antigen ligase family protein, partial [Propionicimonas sp.]